MNKLVFLAVFVLLLVPLATAIDSNTKGAVPVYVNFALENGSGSQEVIADYSSTPMNFSYAPAAGVNTRITRMIITVADSSISDADVYGGLASALTNGLNFTIQQDGVIRQIQANGPVTTNGEFHMLGFDVSFDATSLGQGLDYVSVRWTFDKSGTPLRLEGDKGDKIFIQANDDFTGLNRNNFIVQGYEEASLMGGEWQVAAAILVGLVMFIMFKASKDLDEQHWPLKTGLFYGGLALAWGATNLALRMAIDNSVTAQMTTALELIYAGTLWIGLLSFGYLLIKFLWWAGSRMMMRPEAVHEKEEMF